MKQIHRLTNTLIASTIAFAMVSSLAAQTAFDGVAKVVRVKGPARFTTGNNVWQPLKVGALLKPGTLVQTSTEQGSFVDLVLGDASAPVPSPVIFKPAIPNSFSSSMGYQPSSEQNIVRIWENTALGIDKLTATQTGADLVTDTQLDLKAGHITGNVKKMSAASKYEIKLPNGVAGIRGTVYDLTAEGVLKVLVGSVVMAWVDPKTGNVVTQVVMTGQQYDARTGQLTPLSEPDIKNFDTVLTAMRFAAPAAPATYVTDRTVIHNSPVGPGGNGG